MPLYAAPPEYQGTGPKCGPATVRVGREAPQSIICTLPEGHDGNMCCSHGTTVATIWYPRD